MKRKLEKEIGISCQCNPLVCIKDATTGITLVALIVTIVVLLILAGITIMYTMGENSILKKAQDAKDKTAEAVKNEQEYVNQVDNMVNQYINGTETPKEPEEVPVEQIKSDWPTIEKIAGEIAKDDTITSDTEKVTVIVDNKKYTISAGDLFEVEYKGEVRIVRALGFKHDDLVNTAAYGENHNKASISFEFLDFMTGENYMPMNSTNTNENGWANTQMRKDLNGYTTNAAIQSGEIGGLGANLNNKLYIKQVKKKYIGTYDNANSIATSNDYLWLLAASEIVNNGYNGSGTYGYAITSEGSQYKYYQGVTDAWNDSGTGRQKKPNSSGSTVRWWLRSPGYDGNGYFCLVGSTGNANGSHNASYTRGVAPGFSI
ncbi:MAG: hypothetical protein HFJ32_01210 [Clostridia bacterium]|nr:hypothetical protein [Clostridia bacterium]